MKSLDELIQNKRTQKDKKSSSREIAAQFSGLGKSMRSSDAMFIKIAELFVGITDAIKGIKIEAPKQEIVVRVPKIPAPKIPEIKVPEVKIPPINIPEVKIPEIPTPEVTVNPTFKPKIETPPIDTKHLEKILEVGLSKISKLSINVKIDDSKPLEYKDKYDEQGNLVGMTDVYKDGEITYERKHNKWKVNDKRKRSNTN